MNKYDFLIPDFSGFGKPGRWDKEIRGSWPAPKKIKAAVQETPETEKPVDVSP